MVKYFFIVINSLLCEKKIITFLNIQIGNSENITVHGHPAITSIPITRISQVVSLHNAVLSGRILCVQRLQLPIRGATSICSCTENCNGLKLCG